MKSFSKTGHFLCEQLAAALIFRSKVVLYKRLIKVNVVKAVRYLAHYLLYIILLHLLH